MAKLVLKFLVVTFLVGLSNAWAEEPVKDSAAGVNLLPAFNALPQELQEAFLKNAFQIMSQEGLTLDKMLDTTSDAKDAKKVEMPRSGTDDAALDVLRDRF